MSLKLVHIGSWGNDPGRPQREMLGDLPVCDITAYPHGSFEEVLDLEKPDAVIMLSTATFAHRAFLRYCKQRLIPTLHLYHGLMSVQITDDHRGSVKINKLAHLRYALGRARKLITKTFPFYLTALIKTQAKSREWFRFVYDVSKLASGFPIWQPNVAEDAKTTKCAVFTEADREHAHRVYRLALDDIQAVGNPDLISFGFDREMLGSYAPPAAANPTREVIYIDTGLVMQALVFQDLEMFARHLCRTARAMHDQGFKMALRAHPAHDQKALQKFLSGSGIDMIGKEEFVARLRQCAACIVEISSVTVIPALMGIPLLYANYDALSQLRFGPVLTSYPRGHILTDLSQVSAILHRQWKYDDARALSEWISANSGPLPAQQMPQRVAKLVDAMIGAKPGLQC